MLGMLSCVCVHIIRTWRCAFVCVLSANLPSTSSWTAIQVPFPLYLPSRKTLPSSSILTQLLAPRCFPWFIMAACEAVEAECAVVRACWDVYVPAQGCLQSYTELFDSLQHHLASVYLSQFPIGFVCTIRAALRGSKRAALHHSLFSSKMQKWIKRFIIWCNRQFLCITKST